MIDIFTTAKPFAGLDARNQMAALKSWRKCTSIGEIFLYGECLGAEADLKELRIRHIREIRHSQYGTPYLNDMYHDALRRTQNAWIAYFNCDLIFPRQFDSLSTSLSRQKRALRKQFFVGSRLNFDWPQNLQLSTEADLEAHAVVVGTPMVLGGIDFFIHKTCHKIAFKDFIVGRPTWDNWLLFKALSSGWQVTDVTPTFCPLHPNHTYSHVPQGSGDMWEGPEGDANRQHMADSLWNYFDLSDVSRKLKNEEIVQTFQWRNAFESGPTLFWRRVLGTRLSFLARLFKKQNKDAHVFHIVSAAYVIASAFPTLTKLVTLLGSSKQVGTQDSDRKEPRDKLFVYKELRSGTVRLTLNTQTLTLYGSSRSWLQYFKSLVIFLGQCSSLIGEFKRSKLSSVVCNREAFFFGIFAAFACKARLLVSSHTSATMELGFRKDPASSQN